MQIFLVLIFVSIVSAVSLKADCTKDDSDTNSTNILCDTDITNAFEISSFKETKTTTNIIPLYTNNSIYATLNISGINISNMANHTINIGTPNSSRININISTLSNNYGNETINIYGKDNFNNPSSLYIKAINNNSGSLTINGESYNPVVLENATIGGNLFLNNINASSKNLTVKNNIYLKNTSLLIDSDSLILNNFLYLDNSLLKVNNLEVINFNDADTLEIILNKTMVAQGNLTSGIYAENNINLGTAKIKLNFADTYKIKLQESSMYEIMYSKNGEILYSLASLESNTNNLFDIKYDLIEDNGTSLAINLKRIAIYCDVLNCQEDSFINYISKYLEKDSPYENINNLKNALDNNPTNSAVLSLSPLSNDVLLLQNYLNNKIILNSPNGTNLTINSNNGKINDNIFNNSTTTKGNNIYYQQKLKDNFQMGLALSKSKIVNNLYDVDSVGGLWISTYTLSFKENLIDLTFATGLNKYNKTKSNFNNDKAISSTIANNFNGKVKLYKNYFINQVQLIPSVYYNISYLSLNRGIEKGTGLLYENKGNKALVNDFNLGLATMFILKQKLLLQSSLYLSYLNYSSDNTVAKPFELSEDYLSFGKNSYSNLGTTFSLEASYKIKENYGFSITYLGLYYPNTTFINSISATLKYNF
ncbi:MAG: hypothetical protein LBH40_05500 [Alphaproteobacteria bacterium]|nr:hypothetical protein [Alphaproteobacteria bacterium]